MTRPYHRWHCPACGQGLHLEADLDHHIGNECEALDDQTPAVRTAVLLYGRDARVDAVAP